MYITDIKKLVNRQIPLDVFLSSIRNEILSYLKEITSNKSVSNVIVRSQGVFSFEKSDLIQLLKFYLENKILEWDLDYILNAIEFIELEADEKVEEVVFILSTPEINLPITKTSVRSCVEYLEGRAIKIPSKNLFELKNYDYKKEYKTIFQIAD